MENAPTTPAYSKRADRRKAGGVDFERLVSAVDSSIRQLETPRNNRLSAIREYCGTHYADGGAEKVVPTNLLELATTIYVQNLVSGSPRALVSTNVHSLRPFAKKMESVLNQIPDEIGLKETLQHCVLEALFSVAVVKVGISPGKEHDEPFVDIVSLDNYFVDMTAKNRRQIQFEGNTYWMDLEDARRLYGARDLERDEHTTSQDGIDTADSITSDESGETLRDRIMLRDVYIHSTGRLVTYAVTQGKLLRDVPWDGPDGSPYVTLGFSDVPGNILPLPPAALWRDLHDLANSLFRRIARQAEARKTVATFSGGNNDDIQNLRRARDGEGIVYNGPKPELLSLGGVDSTSLAFFLQVKDLFTYLAGNLDNLGGLSPQAETATQEKLIAQAGSARIRAMGGRIDDFCRAIFKRLAWYLWTDPVRKSRYVKSVKGTDIEIVGEWTPETRDGDFLDYDFNVDVYSLQEDSPATKLQKFALVFQQYILPLLPEFQAQGARLNLQAVLDYVARYGNLPEVGEFVEFMSQDGTPQPPVGGQEGSNKPYVPTMNHTGPREYIRRDVASGGTVQGRDAAMAQLLMGANARPEQIGKAGGM